MTVMETTTCFGLYWRFVKLCVCRDLYTTRARMHIANPEVP